MVEELMVNEIPAPLIYKQAIDTRNPDREVWLTAEEGALEAKENTRATAAEAAEQAALEDRFQQGGRTSFKCTVTIGESPCTSWGGSTTKGISRSDERKCCCSTCSHERRGDAAAVAADTSPDLPGASSTSLPSETHASTSSFPLPERRGRPRWSSGGPRSPCWSSREQRDWGALDPFPLKPKLP